MAGIAPRARESNVLIETYWREIAGALLAMWLGVLTFFGRRELSRLDNKAERSDFDATLRRIDEHIQDDKELRAVIEEKFDTIMRTNTETQVQVARIAGRLEGRQ